MGQVLKEERSTMESLWVEFPDSNNKIVLIVLFTLQLGKVMNTALNKISQIKTLRQVAIVGIFSYNIQVNSIFRCNNQLFEANYLENTLFWFRLSIAQHPVLSCSVVVTIIQLSSLL